MLTSITLNGQQTNVGVYDGQIVPSAAAIGDATGNYSIGYTAGKLTINPKTLTITAIDQTKTYNAAAQGEDNATYTEGFDEKVTVDGLAGNDVLTSITLNGQETNAGVYAGKIVPSAAAIGVATGNYNIGYTAGKLTINPAEFEVGFISDVVYNGDEQKIAPVVTFGETTLTAGTDYEVSYSEDTTNVGEVTVTITGKGNFGGTKTATYNITKKPVTIAAQDANKTYGEADPAKFDDAEISEYFNGELSKIDLTVTRTRTTDDEKAGEYKGVLTTGLVAAELNELYPNYSFTVTDADFTIKQKDVTVTALDQTKPNRRNWPDPELKVEIEGVIEGESTDLIAYTISREDAGGTTPGEYAITPTGNADQGNYNVTFVPGTLTVEDTKDMLYNLAQINKGNWYRLERQPDGIRTDLELDSYIKRIKPNSGETEITADEYDYLAEYNFSGLTITLDGITYYYEGDRASVGMDLPYYTVDKAVVLAGKKIGGLDGKGNPRWLVDNRYEEKSEQDVFKRNFTITTHDNDQTAELYNMLKAGNQWYTLKKTSTGDLPSIKNYNVGDVVNKNHYNAAGIRYDFTNTVIPINGHDYIYSEKEYDGLDYYYTIRFDRVVVKDTYHADKERYKADDSWLDNCYDEYDHSKGNSHEKAYHADYYATLHAPTYLAVTLVANSLDEDLTYNGDNQTVSGYKVYRNGEELTDVKFDESVVATGTGFNVGTYDVTFGDTVTTYETKDTTGRYLVTEVVPGSFKIKAADLTIKPIAQTKTYNGELQGEDKATYTTEADITAKVTVEGLQGNDKLSSITLDGRQTNVKLGDDGKATAYTSEIEPSAAAISNASGDATGNYNISLVNGDLTIDPKAVTVTAKSEEFTYDGVAHSNDGYDVDGLVGNDAIEAVVTGSITLPSQSPVTNKLESYEFTAGIPDNYTVTPKDGALTMKNAEQAITITAASEEFTYDGDAHTNKGVTVTTGALLTGDELVAEATGSVTNVADTADGNNPIAEGYKIMHGNEDVTANYKITPVAGKLTINPKAVTVTAKSEEFTYDGTAHSNDGYDVDGLVGNDAIKAVVTGSITFVSESPVTNKLESYEFTTGTPGNYSVTPVDGALTMKNAEQAITITAASQSWTFDGAAHTNNGVTVTTGELFTGDELVASATGSVKNVADTADGNNPIAEGYKVMHGDEDVTASYKITPVAGKLTITPKAITITADDKTKTYGDDEPSLTATTVGLVGTDYIVTTQTRAEGNNIGTYAITTTVTPGQEIAKNYTIETKPGTLTINPRPVTVTADNKAKDFGATDPTLTATVTGLATGESASLISYKLSRAEGENAGTYAISPSGEAAQGNYAVTYVDGTLTIVPEDGVVVTITANSGSYKYDGAQKDLSGYSVTISNAEYTEADFTFNGSSDLKATNAGTYYTNMKVSDFENMNANFENVVFVVNNGTLEITPREITLTSASDSKVYDGNPLTNANVTISGEGFVEGEGVNVTVTGRQTAEGESENTFTYAMANGTVAGNYKITPVFGTLTVTDVEGEEVQYHKLTITYQYEDGTVIKTFARDYRSGDTYSVASDKIAGYTADTATVKGTMGNADVNVIVTYVKATHTLTVKFTSLTDGTQVTNSVTMELKAGDSYTVFVPAVEGYTALTDKVTGVMPDANRNITVFMVPEGSEGELGGNLGGSTGKGGGYNTIEIDDFGTPLGIGDSILGGGEIIE